jgi:hypothetical protein
MEVHSPCQENRQWEKTFKALSSLSGYFLINKKSLHFNPHNVDYNPYNLAIKNLSHVFEDKKPTQHPTTDT